MRSGAIGTVVVAEVTMSAGRNLPRGWRTDPALAGLGTLNNIGVHAFDLLRYLTGSEVSEVACLIGAEPGYQVDTTALVLLRFASGTLAYVNANQSVPRSRDDIVLYGTEGRVLGSNLSRAGTRRHAEHHHQGRGARGACRVAGRLPAHHRGLHRCSPAPA